MVSAFGSFVVSVLAGLLANYIYERFFSRGNR